MIKVLENLRTVDPKEVEKIDKSDKFVGMILDTRNFTLADYPDLKVISRVGVGMDNISFPMCEAKGVKVYNTPCPELSQSVAEFTIGQILTFLKRKKKSIYPMKIGIIGYGRIGQRIEYLLSNMVAHKFYIHDLMWQKTKGFNTKNSLLKNSDIVIISVSGDDRIIGKEELKLMKDNAILVNIARENCIDEDAVMDAINMDHSLGGFISDVNKNYFMYQLEPHYIKNVVITPHIASDTYEARKAMEEMAVENLKKGLDLV